MAPQAALPHQFPDPQPGLEKPFVELRHEHPHIDWPIGIGVRQSGLVALDLLLYEIVNLTRWKRCRHILTLLTYGSVACTQAYTTTQYANAFS